MPKRSSAQRKAAQRKRGKLLAALEAEGGATSMVSSPGLFVNPSPAVAVPPVTAPPAVAEGWTLGPPFVPVGGPHPPEMQVWEAEPQHVMPPNERHLVVVDGSSNDGEEPRWILSEPISADRYFVRVLTQKRLAQLIGTRFRIFSEDIDDKGITSWVLLEQMKSSRPPFGPPSSRAAVTTGGPPSSTVFTGRSSGCRGRAADVTGRSSGCR